MGHAELETDIRACTKCEVTLRKFGVVPRPIFHGAAGHPVFLVGQAPGKTEYRLSAAFQGEAGRSIRSLFSQCGVTDFDRFVYQTSVTKCFPGRSDGSSTDRVPSVGEVNNCVPFLVRQLEIVSPRLLICLGGLSWRVFLTIKEEESSPGFCATEIGIVKPTDVRVPHMVGKHFTWQT